MGQYADYFTFLKFVVDLIDNKEFSMQLYQATSIAQDAFGIHLSESEQTQLKQILKLVDKRDQFEQKNDEANPPLNRSQTSDSSNTTLDKSFNSSPLSQRFSPMKNWSGVDSLSEEERRQYWMHRKKRKAICKRKL